MGEQSRVAFVMAGSRGLGLACATELVRSGRRVAICARDQEALDRAVGLLGDAAGGERQILGIQGDVADQQSLIGALDDARSSLGAIDILVTNAGGPPAGGFFDLKGSDWDLAYQLTLQSFVGAVNHVAPGMREAGFGRIIAIGSSSVARPLPRLTLSNAFRPAIHGLVKDLAVELAGDGVTVNLVSPGRIDTDRVRELDEIRARALSKSASEVRDDTERTIPAGRYGRPSELGAMVAFLASEQASYVTGQSVLVDGGLVPAL